MPDTVKTNLFGPAMVVMATKVQVSSRGGVGALGISIGGTSSWAGDGSMHRHMQFGARIETTIGDPSPPSLALDFLGFWRFRWLVTPGTRTITVRVLQALDQPTRPSVILKANSAIGLNADVETFAGSSATWIAIDPVSFDASATGDLWVELHNNCTGQLDTCYFGKVSVT